METKPERLQKILAAAGLSSRRKAEELIAAGVVSVNGHVITEPGSKADPRTDEIRVDGKLLKGPERHVYLAMYKPKGVMTTVSDPEGRPTVMELLKGVDERVFPVGRLDYMSEGLLLVTNDGDLMAELTRAGAHVAKTYMVKVSGKPSEAEIDKLRNGIMLPPEPGLTGARGKKQPGVERRSFAVMTQPAIIQLAVDQENPWYEVTLTEGRNRQIRRMFEQINFHVEKIKRVRYGSLTLDVEPGEFRYLTPKEVIGLRKSLETPFKPKPLKAKRKGDERKPRVDAARFVKGRRGKPSADGDAKPAFARKPRTAPREDGVESKPRFSPAARERSENFGGPRGPEFGRSGASRDGAPTRRPFVKKTEGFEDRPKRSYVRRDEGSAEERPRRSFVRRDDASVGDRPKRAYVRRDDAGSDARPKRAYTPRGEGSGERKSFGSEFKKPFTGDRKYSRGPGKPMGRGEAGSEGFKPRGEFKPRATGDFKPRGEYKPRATGDFKPRGEYKPRTTGDFKPRGEFKPRSSEGRPSFGDKRPSSFGDKRPSFGEKRSGGFGAKSGGFGEKRSGSFGDKRGSSFGEKKGGFGAKRPGFGPKRPGSGPSRRRPE